MASAQVHELPIPNAGLVERFIASSIGNDIHLVAIPPDGTPEGRWFGEDAQAAAAWALDRNRGGAGLYWTVNSVRPGLGKKPKKSDITAARFLHIDIDPPFDRAETIERLLSARFPPSFILDSGNGLQAFWRLEYAAENLPAVEDLNKRAAVEYGGDHCHNIDRLMRLPGTVNFPNALKRSKGRVQTLASIVHEDGGESVDPLDMDGTLPALPPAEKVEREAVKIEGVALVTLAELDIRTANKLHAMITAPANPDRSAASYSVACEMLRQGFDDRTIAGVLLNPDMPISGHCLDQPSPKRAVSRILGAARSDPSIETGGGPSSTSRGSGDRPVIQIRAGELHLIATEAESALLGAGAPLYVRGGLVRPIVDDVPAAHGRRTKVARLAPAEASMLVDHLSRVASFEKYSERKKGWVNADPPLNVASILLSRDGEWRFRQLAGVITTPTLRPDGSILSAPGYDEATKLLLLDPPPLPPMPDILSREYALSALNALDDLLDEFPFVDDASRAVALSGLITPVVRGAMSVVPLHATTAPVAGSGKSYIIDIASMIATGERAPVIAAGQNDEETEKRLASALLNGQPIVSIDNVNGRLGGDQLCQMIERPLVSVRPLGVSKLVKIESRATCYATGNNIQLLGDMTRRGILCSLDPNMERPELRQFKRNPLDTVLANRGRFVAAALVVVRAYVLAGHPDALPSLASFEEWSRLVRSALVWLGRADPCETMEKARGEDPVIAQLNPLLNAWYDTMSSSPKATGEVIEAAETVNAYGNRANGNLYQALLEVAEDRKGGLSSVSLGKYLARHKGRIVNGLKLTVVEDGHAKQALWKVGRV
jgi:putative DNA primase/helicase